MPRIRIADVSLTKGTYLHIKTETMDDIIRVTRPRSRTARGRVLKSKTTGDIGRLFIYVLDGFPNTEIKIIKKKDLPLELL
jgi:hypothetical protein